MLMENAKKSVELPPFPLCHIYKSAPAQCAFLINCTILEFSKWHNAVHFQYALRTMVSVRARKGGMYRGWQAEEKKKRKDFSLYFHFLLLFKTSFSSVVLPYCIACILCQSYHHWKMYTTTTTAAQQQREKIKKKLFISFFGIVHGWGLFSLGVFYYYFIFVFVVVR